MQLQLLHGYQSTTKVCELWLDKMLTKSQPLHSQSRQAVRKRYFEGWAAYRALQKNGHKKARPPYKDKFYQTTSWRRAAIHFKGDMLVLSNGLGNEPLKVKLPKNFDLAYAISHIAIVELVYDKGQYSLHFVYGIEKALKSDAEGIVGVDIGEIHPMVSHDGIKTMIFNGRYIRSLYRLRNKVITSFGKKIDRCKRHSKRWWHLVKRKWRYIRKIDNQIRDGLHKHTTKFVQMCKDGDIATIVIGDLTGIREDINYSKHVNQKLHQWAFGKVTQLISYKAKALGIKVEVIDESYTSQTCPSCGEKHKPNDRRYTCKCGFHYHRDGVGAINIRQKYLGHLGDPVAADMAPPVGMRLECQRCSA